MKTKKLIFILMSFFAFQLSSQIDYQWYIKDGYGISSFDQVSRTPSHGNNIASGTFYIDSVSHPLPGNARDQYRNDVFIIFNGNNYYNSRYITSNPLAGTTGKYGYNIITPLTPKFLYFSNLYETDDPPKRIVANNGSSSKAFSPISISTAKLNAPNPLNRILSTNHSLLVGKDVTLIIDKNQCKIQNIKAELTFDNQILTLQNAFNSQSTWTFNSGPAFEPPNKIYIFPNSNNYEFINFRVNSTTNPATVFSIFGCSNPIAPLTEIISSSYHDPNYVQVKCIYTDNTGQSWVKYRVQAFNDGDESSGIHVKFKLILPNTVDANSAIVCNWNHGGKTGCGLGKVTKTMSIDTTIFSFDTSLPKVTGTGGHHNPNKCQMAWLEFCVKIKSGLDPLSCNLQPSIPISNFSDGIKSTPYAIAHFIDICTFKSDEKQRCERQISNNCNCYCKARKWSDFFKKRK